MADATPGAEEQQVTDALVRLGHAREGGLLLGTGARDVQAQPGLVDVGRVARAVEAVRAGRSPPVGLPDLLGSDLHGPLADAVERDDGLGAGVRRHGAAAREGRTDPGVAGEGQSHDSEPVAVGGRLAVVTPDAVVGEHLDRHRHAAHGLVAGEQAHPDA